MLKQVSICAGFTRNLRPSHGLTPRFKPVVSSVAGFRRLSSHAAQPNRPYRVAVVGSGPAGFYAASRLLSKNQDTYVDMFEKLPVPFGLARYGVAPDHPEVKNCEDKFEEVALSPRFNFVGNIDLGNDLPLAALKPHYDAILFAYGASQDRELGIPGENVHRSVYSARSFVGWYNGLPEHRDLEPNLTSGEDAVIVGQGNVALDVARILLSGVDALKHTDITDYALETLSKSRIRRVRVVGRRGPLQASFTIKEIRELLQLPNIAFDPISNDVFPPNEVVAGLPRAQKRLMQLLAKGSINNPSTATKSWSLDFLLSPDSLHYSPTDSSHLTHAMFARNELDPADPYSPSSKVTAQTLPNGERAMVDLQSSVFFRSVGYKSLALPGMQDLGIEFDARRGVIPNDGLGRVISPSGMGSRQDLPDGSVIALLPGLYCAGWVKRGPTGVIASTMADAFTTADTVLHDLTTEQIDRSGNTGLGWEGLEPEAVQRGLRTTSWQDWQRIDAAERQRGQERGKIREKFGRVEEMLAVLE